MDNGKPARPWFGSLLIVASAVAYSTAGYFTRLIELDVPTLLFWRGLFGGIFMSACIAVIYRGKTLVVVRKTGLAGLAVACLSAFATVCCLEALRRTTVAEVMAINATSPFVSGTLAWLILGEREHWRVVVASLFALGGVGIMVGPGALGGHLSGAILAFAMTSALAMMVVIIRIKKSISMLPASCLSAFLSALVVLPVASGALPHGITMVQLALFGVVQFGLGLVFLTLGARRVTALRSGLLSRLQTVLGPTWVWLGFGEVPPPAVLIGGSIVLASALAAAVVADSSPRAAAHPARHPSDPGLVPASRAG